MATTTQVSGVRFAGGEYVQANRFSGTTIGLDLTGTSQATGGTLSGGVYHLSNTVACHLELSSTAAPTANNSHTMLMPGERLVIIPDNWYIAVVKVSGQPDGILRMTLCE